MPTVGQWRKRLFDLGAQGLHDDARPRVPCTYDDEKVAAAIHRVLHERPKGSRIWSVRQMADKEGISKSTAQRGFSLFGAEPHLSKTFKLSSDPFFIEAARVHRPISQSSRPCCRLLRGREDPDSSAGPYAADAALGFGYTHDYIRHGTTTLSEALDVPSGKVTARCRRRHRHQEWLSFLRLIDRATPAELDLHLVCDNYPTHKHARVRDWSAKNPRVHLHFTPTYTYWLNQVERCFALPSQRATSARLSTA